MELCYINLHSSTHRRKHIEEQLSHYSHFITNTQRIEAVEGIDIDRVVVDRNHCRNFSGGLCTPAEIGCTVSHLYAISAVKDDLSIVVEDDVIIDLFCIQYDEIIQLVKELPSDWECLQLCTINGSAVRELSKQSHSHKFETFQSHYFGAAGYLVNKKAVSKIQKMFFHNNVCTVPTAFLESTSFVADMFIYNILKTYTTTRQFVSFKVDLPSTIHTDHEVLHREAEREHEKSRRELYDRYIFPEDRIMPTTEVKTYVINLDRATDRLQQIQKWFNIFKQKFYRFRAVDKLHIGLVDHFRRIYEVCTGTHNNYASCLLSHILLLDEHFLKRSKDKYIIVLEDDARLCARLPTTNEEIDQMWSDDTDILYLHNRVQVNSDREVNNGCGLEGYIVSRLGAEKIINVCKNANTPIDLRIQAHFPNCGYLRPQHEHPILGPQGYMIHGRKSKVQYVKHDDMSLSYLNA
jgi:GR25 family glycosyltransferase involved in LPS biosynthesis